MYLFVAATLIYLTFYFKMVSLFLLLDIDKTRELMQGIDMLNSLGGTKFMKEHCLILKI